MSQVPKKRKSGQADKDAAKKGRGKGSKPADVDRPLYVEKLVCWRLLLHSKSFSQSAVCTCPTDKRNAVQQHGILCHSHVLVPGTLE